MKKRIRHTALLFLASTITVPLISLADELDSSQRADMKELIKEQRKEMRQMRHEHRSSRMLERVDSNNDGQVDLNEYLAHAQQRFEKLDMDSNGFLTQEEARESMQKMREEHKERRQQMRDKRGEPQG